MGDGYFPFGALGDIGAYLDGYAESLTRALAGIDRAALGRAAEMLSRAMERDAQIYVCGNGGSAAISNHLVCDHSKGVQTDTGLKPRVISLAANVELMTAIANDISYAEVFVYQLRTLARPGDVLVSISSSGDSDNIVRAVEWAKANGIATLAMTGFKGGRSAALADVSLHVEAGNYGIIEDAHQALMHVLAQFIRQDRMDPSLIGLRRF